MDYYSFRYGIKPCTGGTMALDADPSFKEEEHPRENKGEKGGQFAEKSTKAEEIDDLTDEAVRVEKKGTEYEKGEIAKGEDPETSSVEKVLCEHLSTMGDTKSKYRNLRNESFRAIEELRKAGKKDVDGTYPLPIGNPPKKVQHKRPDGTMKDGFADGFQVSFQTTNGEGFNPSREVGRDGKPLFMNDATYDATVEKIMKETGSKAYVGIFGGIPEISFRCDTKEQAMELAKRYNQVSIADNEKIANDQWDDPEIFPHNPAYEWRDNQVLKIKG